VGGRRTHRSVETEDSDTSARVDSDTNHHDDVDATADNKPNRQNRSAEATAVTDTIAAKRDSDVTTPATATSAAGKLDYSATYNADNGVITGVNKTPSSEVTYNAIGKPAAGAKVVVDKTTGDFSFLPNASQLSPTAPPGQFRLLVAETTALDALLEQSPLLKPLVQPILVTLHQMPIVNDVLAPVIGRSRIYTITVPIATFVGQDKAPIAYTTTVLSSLDGTPISVNWFPAIGLAAGEKAPTILNGPSLATAGYIDPNQELTVFGLVPGLKPLRAAGYNVVTWDPRGEFSSGGVLHLDSPHYEAVDVSSIINWVSALNETQHDPGSATDPLIGMVGGSYGGGIQLTTAGIDSRVDAIAPGIAWNNLEATLYPHDAFKTAWSSLLLLSLVVSGSRIDSEIYSGIITGALAGILTKGQRDFLNENSPDNVVDQITVPTLFLQGTVDTLFPLQQALNNATQIQAATPAVPIKMIWYCGGHGKCLDPVDQDAQSKFLVDETLRWMDTYVKGKQDNVPPPPVTERAFEWVDQRGGLYSTDYLPTDAEHFFGDPLHVSGSGHLLPVVPLLGGSGPQDAAGFPVSLVLGSPAANAVNVSIPQVDETTYVVGAPELTLTYRGLGTARSVYAQIVDEDTNRVVGNIVSPIPVKLDGTAQTVTVSMENIAYTMLPTSKLRLQITTTATPYENVTAFGAIDIETIDLTLPTATGVTRRQLPQAPPERPLTSRTGRTLEDLLLGK
jgi:ABC-2 type transport system ATP-binding protein